MDTQELAPGPLPADAATATLVGRIWDPEVRAARVVAVAGDYLVDLSGSVDSVSSLVERDDSVEVVRAGVENGAAQRWPLEDVLAGSTDTAGANDLRLLAPIDLQVVKACGVTFVDSMVERLIEERCAGNPKLAAEMRERVTEAIGGSLADLRPGSAAAAEVKQLLVEQGLWSAYLEVGIGPDPEVFSKAPVLASVGYGAGVGVPDFSSWNNPEPELVLVVDSRGAIRGATLGNDVNLRDVEGRSALLLGKAKDNNASSAIGPFVRLFDAGFNLESVREEEISLRVDGPEGYVMTGVNSVGRISRPFEELVAATHGVHHQYPDGFVLYTGTLFAPTADRGAPGLGFTHSYGDTVKISSPHLGTLLNTVRRMEDLEPWEYGISEHIAGQRRIDRSRAR
ncbi:fumarylacetoacetate (FAA) hydrolase family protein [Leucobacter komagatae]|uniref:Fumarylacetoacetate (FAA) hydrolase family protein n=1 Tax=Leucobacter komagatae TaxID=55969 RepID=A0A542Y843_9MICO|nr:fumarylacetoacetate hydrolase family protein [Leucobacter komagatae]TQL44259.1 fumarylacetoacetate (FAA) hydrolase family protein [Leucobacter komagatae]